MPYALIHFFVIMVLLVSIVILSTISRPGGNFSWFSDDAADDEVANRLSLTFAIPQNLWLFIWKWRKRSNDMAVWSTSATSL